MHQFRGFTDLRVNRQNQSSDATLWPSFTDIMTVILMVFMLTMVVVIIKNADLINQIRLSRSLQADSEQQLRDNVQVLADLRLRNTDLEEAVRSTRMEIILLSDEMQRLEENLNVKAAAIARLAGEKEELEENLRLIRMRMTEKDQELEDAQLMIGGIKDEAERANRELSLQIAQLLSSLEENETAMLTLTDQKSDLEMALARQRKDFSSLEDKYLQLVRPARSSLGKHVVSVQMLKTGQRPEYLIKELGQDTWRSLSRDDLFVRLGQLETEYGEDLYIKVVIPDNSGLSYNEAWDFTKQVLSEFDYYYTDGW
jgi:DNA repair exonuclease SbcCD ATPase subunit